MEENKSNTFVAPVIEYFVRGSVEVKLDHLLITYKDVKIWPNNVEPWNWQDCGTRHDPGVTWLAVESMLTHVDILILSTGMDRALMVPSSLVDKIKTNTLIDVRVVDSSEAVKLYNELISSQSEGGEKKKIGLLLHSTC